MTDVVSCPGIQPLQQLVLGRLSELEAEGLERHVQACALCGAALQNLEAEDTLVRLVRVQAVANTSPDDAVEGLIGRLKALAATAATTTDLRQQASAPGGEPPVPEAVTREVCAVLAGTEMPGAIGRLGPYRIVKVLGAGGMGVVFQAEDEVLQRPVALKVIRPSLADSSTARQRFLQEARAIAAVEHDHIITVHQVGEDRGVLYLAMPLLKGETLEARLKRQGKLPPAEVLRIGREVAEGLAAAHEGKLIHRDVKPGNIWLEEKSGRVKILDFGLAQAVDDPAHLTGSGVVAGTPSYMAPEQAAGTEVDPRCDLFSLGSVLYRASTGELPFRGTGVMQVLRALEMEQPKLPREINPELPTPLANLMMQLLAKDREQRPPSARQVAEALRRMAQEPAVRGTSPSPFDGQISQSATTALPRQRRRRLSWQVTWLAIMSLGAALAVSAFRIGSFVFRSPDRGLTSRPVVDAPAVDAGDLPNPNNPGPLAAPGPPPEGPPGEVFCLRGHEGPVGPVVCSPDGRRALSGSWDGTMRLWDLEARKELHTFRGHTGWVWSVTFAPDNRPALSVGRMDHWVKKWNLERGQSAGGLPSEPGRFLGVAYLPRGPCALKDLGGALQLMNLDDPLDQCWLNGHTDEVWRVAFAADGRWLLSGGRDRTARLWDLQTGAELCRFKSHSAAIHAVALSPDGHRVLTGSADGDLRLWDADSGQLLRGFAGHTGVIESAAFSPDGRRALSGGQDKILRLWDVATGMLLCPLEGHTEPIGGVAFTPDGRRALSAGGDGTIRVWRLPPG